MNWQEEMRMGLKLIKDACSKVDTDEWEELCAICPFRDYCVMGTEIPQEWKYDDNGVEL
jgi:hypothetical protein